MVINEHRYYQYTAGPRLFVNAGMTQPVPQQRQCSWYILYIEYESLGKKPTDPMTKAKSDADSDCKSRKDSEEISLFDGS